MPVVCLVQALILLQQVSPGLFPWQWKLSKEANGRHKDSQDLDSELAQHHVYHILLVKPSPDSRGGETGATP